MACNDSEKIGGVRFSAKEVLVALDAFSEADYVEHGFIGAATVLKRGVTPKQFKDWFSKTNEGYAKAAIEGVKIEDFTGKKTGNPKVYEELVQQLGKIKGSNVFFNDSAKNDAIALGIEAVGIGKSITEEQAQEYVNRMKGYHDTDTAVKLIQDNRDAVIKKVRKLGFDTRTESVLQIALSISPVDAYQAGVLPDLKELFDIFNTSRLPKLDGAEYQFKLAQKITEAVTSEFEVYTKNNTEETPDNKERIDAERKVYIDAILDKPYIINDKLSFKTVRQIYNTVNDTDATTLNLLETSDLNKLYSAREYIESGNINPYIKQALNKLQSKMRIEKLLAAINKAKGLGPITNAANYIRSKGDEAFFNESRNLHHKALASDLGMFADDIYRTDDKELPLWTYGVKDIAVEDDKYQLDFEAIQTLVANTRTKHRNSVLRKKGYNTNDISLSLSRISIANFWRFNQNNNNITWTAEELLDTILTSPLGELGTNDIDYQNDLEESLEAFIGEDGVLDGKKLIGSFNDAELEVLNINQKVLGKLGDKITNIGQTNNVDQLQYAKDFVYHNIVESKLDDKGNLKTEGDITMNRWKEQLLKANSSGVRRNNILNSFIKKDSDENAPLVNIKDPLADILGVANAVLFDNYVTPQVEAVNDLMNDMDEYDANNYRSLPKEKREMIHGFRNYVHEAVNNKVNVRQHRTTSKSNLLQKVETASYKLALADPIRSIGELISQVPLIATYLGPEFLTGMGADGRGLDVIKDDDLGREFFKYIDSVAYSKIYSELLGSRDIDPTLFDAGERVKGKYTNANMANLNKILFTLSDATKTGAFTESMSKASNFLIRSPEVLLARTAFFGAFYHHYKKISGKDFDIHKFVSDGQYRVEALKYLPGVETRVDEKFFRVFGSNQDLAKAQGAAKKSDQGQIKATLHRMMSFFNQYIILESNNMIAGVNNLVTNGRIPKDEAAALLMGSLGRSSSYFTVIGAMYAGLYALLGIDSDDDKFDFAETVKFQLLGTIVTAGLLRNFNNIHREGLSQIVEYANREYLSVLRGGQEYDPYKHGILFTVLKEKDFHKGFSGNIGKFTGVYQIPIKQADNLRYSKDPGRDAILLTLAYSVGIPGFKTAKNILYQYDKNKK